MVSIHENEKIDLLLRASGLQPKDVQRLRTNFFKHFGGGQGALSAIGEPLKNELAAAISFHSLELTERLDSEVDGASRLIFRQGRGLLLESVILRMATGRCSLCISCQVGCAAGCRFCATGQMRQAVNLTADEILDQLVQANGLLQAEDRRTRNIVFMGMGEPFHNEAAVTAAVSQLIDPTAFNHSAMKILVSTVGIPDAMVRFATRFPQVNLALSLHTVDQDTRQQIIPVARRISLDDIRDALVQVEDLRAGRTMMIEYLLLDGINDSDLQITALGDWLEGLSVHVNLIPFNPSVGEGELRPTPVERRVAIGAALKARGFTCTLRYSLGADIAAACGQLVTEANRTLLAVD